LTVKTENEKQKQKERREIRKRTTKLATTNTNNNQKQTPKLPNNRSELSPANAASTTLTVVPRSTLNSEKERRAAERERQNIEKFILRERNEMVNGLCSVCDQKRFSAILALIDFIKQQVKRHNECPLSTSSLVRSKHLL